MLNSLLVTSVLLLFAISAVATPDWLELGGQMRLRIQSYDGQQLSDDIRRSLDGRSVIGDDDDWILTRLRLHATAHASDRLRFFVQLSDARIFEDESHMGDRPGTRWNWENDRLDLFQGYVDMKLQPGIHLKLGRQVLELGSGRMFSEYEWWNVPLSFDGARLEISRESWDLDIFALQLVVNDDSNFNTTDDGTGGRFGSNDDSSYYGIYLSTRPTAWLNADAFAYLRDNDNMDSCVYTLGTRLQGRLGANWDFEAEFMAQPGGEVGGKDHQAWAMSTEVGYTFWLYPSAPRAFLGYDFGSGDEDPGDDDSETFDVVTSNDYLNFGFQEMVQQRNLHALRAGVEADLGETQAAFTAYSFWVDQDDDKWHGRYQRFANAEAGRSAKNHLGTELDLSFRRPLQIGGRTMTGVLGYSYFFTGSFVPDSGDADMGYPTLQMDF